MSEDGAPAARPAKRKKKRRRRPDPEQEAAARAEAIEGEESPEEGERASDDGRPAFARSYPNDPELARVVDLFEAGHYAEVRTLARKLVHATDSDDVRKAARDVLARLEPDPLAKILLAAAAILLVFLAGWFWTHPHGGP